MSLTLGFIQASRWFGQKIGLRMNAINRRFDDESTDNLLSELRESVDSLEMALDMEVGGVDAAVEVGTIANMIAFVVESRVVKMKEPVIVRPPKKEVEEMPPLPKRKPGRKKGKGRRKKR